MTVLRFVLPGLLALVLLLGLIPGCTSSGGSRGGGGGAGGDGGDGGFGDDDDSSGGGGGGANGPDSDGDGITDEEEGTSDADGDGIPNDEDLDSDGDGVSDSEEAGDGDLSTPPIDTDEDGVPDYLDADSDGNGVPDELEGAADVDGDGVPNSSDVDNDGDGILDEDEVGDDPTSPVDSDGDGIPDYLDEDSDNDGVADFFEGNDDPDGDGIPSYLDTDADNDGIPDGDELGPDPNNPSDVDGDGYYDFEDADSDNDGLTDRDEEDYGTDIFDRDTDGDGFTDAAEAAAGSDPTDAGSVISGYYAELAPRANTVIEVPFTPELVQADVMFVLDTTCSMMGVLNTMANNFSQVVSQLPIPDVAFGVGEFDDYAYGDLGYTYAGDKPFHLRQQVTSSTSSVASMLGSLGTRDGGDLPESAIEGLYQAASGMGYDQDCDNVYDSAEDVPPFIADTTDAFSGSAAGSYQSTVIGTGSIGGAGFRAGSLPILVYTTDNLLRDADLPSQYVLPPTCSDPAGTTILVNALDDIGAKLIGCATNSTPTAQMTNLANLTNSHADLNGDGFLQPLVFQDTSGAVVNNVIAGITALADSGQFDVTLEVDDAPYNFVQQIDPLSFIDTTVGTTVTFSLSLYPGVLQTPTDQVFVFPLQVLGDGVTILAEWELVLVVLAG